MSGRVSEQDIAGIYLAMSAQARLDLRTACNATRADRDSIALTFLPALRDLQALGLARTEPGPVPILRVTALGRQVYDWMQTSAGSVLNYVKPPETNAPGQPPRRYTLRFASEGRITDDALGVAIAVYIHQRPNEVLVRDICHAFHIDKARALDVAKEHPLLWLHPIALSKSENWPILLAS